MKQVIKTTHIDTGGHGYYSVSKKDISLLGIADKITGFSGQTLSRVYLEEDQDAALLFDTAKEKGVEIQRKQGYNLKFPVTHNYDPALFDWQPSIGEIVITRSDNKYTLVGITKNNLIVENAGHTRYKISLSNPFAYIKSVTKKQTT